MFPLPGVVDGGHLQMSVAAYVVSMSDSRQIMNRACARGHGRSTMGKMVVASAAYVRWRRGGGRG
jgi:hypothetical protein